LVGKHEDIEPHCVHASEGLDGNIGSVCKLANDSCKEDVVRRRAPTSGSSAACVGGISEKGPVEGERAAVRTWRDSWCWELSYLRWYSTIAITCDYGECRHPAHVCYYRPLKMEKTLFILWQACRGWPALMQSFPRRSLGA